MFQQGRMGAYQGMTESKTESQGNKHQNPALCTQHLWVMIELSGIQKAWVVHSLQLCHLKLSYTAFLNGHHTILASISPEFSIATWTLPFQISTVAFQSLVGILSCFVPIGVVKITIKSNLGRKVSVSPYILQSIVNGSQGRNL